MLGYIRRLESIQMREIMLALRNFCTFWGFASFWFFWGFFWLWSLDLFWDSIWNNLGLDFGSIFWQVGTTVIVVSVSVRGFAAHAAVAADAAHASALSLRLGTVAGMASGWITKKLHAA